MDPKVLPARFYLSETGNNPVREFLMDLPVTDRRAVGIAIARMEFGWPVGMPVCRLLRDQIWEIRVTLASNRIARVLFTPHEGEAILLHAFVKKTPKTPKSDINLAMKRKGQIKEAQENEE